MKLRRLTLVAVAVASLVLCACTRVGPSGALPAHGGVTALPAGAQRLTVGGLVVTVQSTSSPLPAAGPSIPKDPGTGRRWLSIVASLTNPTDAAIPVGAGVVGPHLTDTNGHAIDSAFEGINVPGSSNLSAFLPGPALRSRGVAPRPAGPAVAPGDTIRVQGQWAVPAAGTGFRYVWELGPPGVARFVIR